MPEISTTAATHGPAVAVAIWDMGDWVIESDIPLAVDRISAGRDDHAEVERVLRAELAAAGGQVAHVHWDTEIVTAFGPATPVEETAPLGPQIAAAAWAGAAWLAAPLAVDLADLRRHDAERVALRLRGACIVAGHAVADVTTSIDRTAIIVYGPAPSDSRPAGTTPDAAAAASPAITTPSRSGGAVPGAGVTPAPTTTDPVGGDGYIGARVTDADRRVAQDLLSGDGPESSPYYWVGVLDSLLTTYVRGHQVSEQYGRQTFAALQQLLARVGPAAVLSTCGPAAPTPYVSAMTPTRRAMLRSVAGRYTYAEAGNAWSIAGNRLTSRMTEALAAGWVVEGATRSPGSRWYELTDAGREQLDGVA
jgi:hypothetical protein